MSKSIFFSLHQSGIIDGGSPVTAINSQLYNN